MFFTYARVAKLANNSQFSRPNLFINSISLNRNADINITVIF